MSLQSEVNIDTENAKLGIVPPVHHRITTRNEPPAADSFNDSKPTPSIKTDEDITYA
jgi:hypothetical protein